MRIDEGFYRLADKFFFTKLLAFSPECGSFYSPPFPSDFLSKNLPLMISAGAWGFILEIFF
jgi:hypothetical protein